jgi:hypothetical protein
MNYRVLVVAIASTFFLAVAANAGAPQPPSRARALLRFATPAP